MSVPRCFCGARADYQYPRTREACCSFHVSKWARGKAQTYVPGKGWQPMRKVRAEVTR